MWYEVVAPGIVMQSPSASMAETIEEIKEIDQSLAYKRIRGNTICHQIGFLEPLQLTIEMTIAISSA